MKIKKLFNSKWKIAIWILAILLIMVLFYRFIDNNRISNSEEKILKQVELSSVYDLSTGSVPLDLVGTIESQSEAIIRSESQGEVKAVYVKVDDNVFAGEILAEIKNASQYAEVQRAQAVLESAQASLSKITGSSNQNISLLKNEIRSSLNTAEDAIRSRVDLFIENSNNRFPTAKVFISNSVYKNRIEDGRYEMNVLLSDWSDRISDLSSLNSFSELESLVLYSQASLSEVDRYLSDVILGLNYAEPSDLASQSEINTYISNVSTARSTTITASDALLSTYNSLRSQIGLESKGEDLLSAEASVRQAEASLLAAQINLEKTILRAPISGKVNFISVQQGDVVNNLQEVSQVIGSGELEIVAYITEEEKRNINAGDQVLISIKQGTDFLGTIERIAPAINPNTQKIEVRIKPESEEGLINGQSVNLEIVRELENEDSIIISLPIESVKITDTEIYVFVVVDGKLEKRDVLPGQIIGDKLIIESGISLQDEIVKDARGLKIGQEVNTN